MSWIKVAGFNLLLIFIFALILEFFFGRWTDGNIPKLEYQIFHTTHIDRSELGIFPKKITVQPISNGFRSSKEINYNENCLIITMGGSTTQEYILSQKETWSQQLQEKINKIEDDSSNDCSGSYVVLNTGMSGHNIINNLWLLKNYIIESKYSPIAIIIYQGINDWHVTLNKESAYYKKLPFMGNLKNLYHELYRDLKYKSFFFELVQNITSPFTEDKNNKAVSNNHNNGFLFKIAKPSKTTGGFVYENINSNLMSKFNDLEESKHHKRYIQKLIDTVQRELPQTKLIFITQTESICNLTSFPNSLSYKTSNNKNNHTEDKDPIAFNPDDWRSNRGVCYRLGIIKTNYNSVVKNNNSVKIIDYAGKIIENSDESYDDYHKTPYGSKKFFDRVSPQLVDFIQSI